MALGDSSSILSRIARSRRWLLAALAGLWLAGGAARNSGFAGTDAGAGPRLVPWRCGSGDCPGYEYDPAVGEPDYRIGPGIAFEALPDDFACPRCGAGKAEFRPLR